MEGHSVNTFKLRDLSKSIFLEMLIQLFFESKLKSVAGSLRHACRTGRQVFAEGPLCATSF